MTTYTATNSQGMTFTRTSKKPFSFAVSKRIELSDAERADAWTQDFYKDYISAEGNCRYSVSFHATRAAAEAKAATCDGEVMTVECV